MALVVVATFLSLTEAQIAAGALEASGLHPHVADLHFGSAMWTEQFALQGFRVSVPHVEAADAVVFLSSSRSRKIKRPREGAGAYLWRGLAAFLLFGLGGVAGWLPVAGLRRRRQASPRLLAVAGASVAAVLVAYSLAWLALGLVEGLQSGMESYFAAPLGVALVIWTARTMRLHGDRIGDAVSSSQADSD